MFITTTTKKQAETGDKTALELDSGESCSTLNILKPAQLHTLKGKFYGMWNEAVIKIKKKKKSRAERSDVYEEEWKEASPPSSLRKNDQGNKKVKEKQAEAEASQVPATSLNRLQRGSLLSKMLGGRGKQQETQ